jgi:signal transduction histidine kinase
MDPLFVAHVTVFAVAALVSFASVVPARRVDHPDTRYGLVGLLVTSGVWAGAQAAYLVVPTVVAKEAFYVLGLIAGIVSVLTWLYFAAAYSGRSPQDAPYRRSLVAVVAGLVLLKVTNPLHNAYFTASMASEPFVHLALEYGAMHWLAMGFSYSLAFVGFYMLIERFGQAGVSTRPLEALVMLTALPLGLNILALRTEWLLPLTYEPLGVAAFGVGTLAVYFDRFQTVQLAADVEAPVIVLDAASRIASVNEQTERLFPETADSLGKPLETVRPRLSEAVGDDSPLEVPDEDGPRFFQVSSSPFYAGDTETGSVVILSEVTERERYRRDLERKTEQLALLNRIVRHDIRNEMGVVIGWGQTLEGHVDSDGRDALDRLLGAANHVVDLTDRAREFVTALDEDERPETQAVDLVATLETELEKQRSAHPEATITVAEDPPAVAVRANEMLGAVFRNLVSNAIENVDHEEPTVTVTVTEREDSAVVRVADDGPGIPDDRKDRVFGKGEKGIDSAGTGIGLFLVKTLVEQFDGQVWIEDNEPRGSVFVVELPLAATAE